MDSWSPGPFPDLLCCCFFFFFFFFLFSLSITHTLASLATGRTGWAGLGWMGIELCGELCCVGAGVDGRNPEMARPLPTLLDSSLRCSTLLSSPPSYALELVSADEVHCKRDNTSRPTVLSYSTDYLFACLLQSTVLTTTASSPTDRTRCGGTQRRSLTALHYIALHR